MKFTKKIFGVLLSLGIFANTFVPVCAKSIDTFEPIIKYVDNVDNPTFLLGQLSEESNMSAQNIVRKYYNSMLESKKADKLTNASKVLYSEKSSKKEFSIVKDYSNSKSKNVVKTIQTYNGTPVYGTEKNFHVNKKGVIECIIGSSVEDIDQRVIPLNPVTKVNPATVIRAIEKDLGFEPKYETPPKQEKILFPVGENYVYAYRVRIVVGGEHRIDSDYIVDANNLSIIEVKSNIAAYEQPIPGSGIGQSGNVVNNLEIMADYANNIFYLKSGPEKVETCLRYIENSQILCPVITENDSFFDSGTKNNYQTHGVDAHNNLTKVSKFFRSSPFYRNGNDDQGSTLVVRILKHDPYRVNAYSTTNEISFCTGLGPSGKGTAAALDIAGHEYTHGILFSEGLAYSSTSTEHGAIHEGVADVFGTLCEYFIPHEGVFDWTAGEDTGTVMRDCASPQIDDYTDYIQAQPLPHLGGGVITKAAYLLANGGTHNNHTVAGIGYSKLAEIFYDAINDGYIVENMTFMQFSGAVTQAATLLYGSDSQEVQSVRDSF
ncbi:MAG: peptidase M4, partial [Clostridiaceae bacterium]|nr:peptidase M4 [Clostridiaceae bacterium]